MPFPDDEINGAKGFRKTELVNPNTGRRVTDTETGNVVNYAPSTPPIGAAPGAFQNSLITSLLPQLSGRAPASAQPTRQQNIDTWGNGLGFTGITEHELKENPALAARFQEHMDAIRPQVDSHESAVKQASAYLKLQSEVNNQRESAQSDLDSADFIGALGQLDHSSPNFDVQATKLFAKFPRAKGEAVKAALDLRTSARQQFLHGTAKGGADQFPDGSPEHEAYVRRFAQTRNPLEAQAHAESTQKNEEALRTHIAAGVFDPAELAWEKGKPVNPEFFTAHGTPNYSAINLAASKRAGDLAKGKLDDHNESLLMEGAKAILGQFKGKVLKPDDPNFARVNRAQAIFNRAITPPGRAPLGAPAAAVVPPAADGTPPAAAAGGTPPPVSSASRYIIK